MVCLKALLDFIERFWDDVLLDRDVWLLERQHPSQDLEDIWLWSRTMFIQLNINHVPIDSYFLFYEWCSRKIISLFSILSPKGGAFFVSICANVCSFVIYLSLSLTTSLSLSHTYIHTHTFTPPLPLSLVMYLCLSFGSSENKLLLLFQDHPIRVWQN